MERSEGKVVIRESKQDDDAWTLFEVWSAVLLHLCECGGAQEKAAQSDRIAMEDIAFPVHGVVSSARVLGQATSRFSLWRLGGFG